MTTDHFAHKAASYEQQKDRVDNVDQIANAIIANVGLSKTMQLLDFGSGTGLLLERIAPHVRSIAAMDISQSMNAQLREKQSRIACAVEIIEMDLEKTSLDRQFDGIISSMTLHHIQNIPGLFRNFQTMLKDGGFIALADLDREDGSFHSENTGVHHSGFVRDEIAQQAQDAQFKNVAMTTVGIISKKGRTYPVFLLTGQR